MVDQITAQKIHQKTTRIPSIPLVRRFTFRTVNHCLTAGYLTPQLVRVFPVPSDLTPPPEGLRSSCRHPSTALRSRDPSSLRP
jgi:hypothetical protein